MKEIGGYFGLEQLIQREYYPDLVAVNNARNALLYLLKARKINKLFLPYFLCNSVSDLCAREGYSYEFYRIGYDFLPIFDTRLAESEYLYIVNYYGQINNAAVMSLKSRYGNIILDNVQAFFQKPIEGVDTIYSCRKFFGVPDGAYLSTTARIDEALQVDTSRDRMKHLLGRYEESASAHYEEFKENDGLFVNLELRYMSNLTHNILGAIDYSLVTKKRTENFAYLADALNANNKLKLNTPHGAFAYPFYYENGLEIKSRLAKKKMYIPTLWPNVLRLDSSIEYDYAANILPLPCDQRYDVDDMQYLLEELLICIN